MNYKTNIPYFVATMTATAIFAIPLTTNASLVPTDLDTFQARPPIHALAGTSFVPQGISPSDVKAAYHLPTTGGSGTIAIISAFHHSQIENDLAAFDTAFALPQCTIQNKCLEIHNMSTVNRTDSGWDEETALDTEWSHAIAPKAKILVVEAASDNGTSLLKALDFATSRADVIAISMSWGGTEFPGETKLESHFSGKNKKLAFFASSGDDGAGVSWPASALNVISVGGTQLILNKTKSKSGKISVAVASEKAWTGSGGGVSAYEPAPAYQSDYAVPRSGNMRAIPDVSYAADPMYGFSVYHSANSSNASGPKSW